MESLHFEEGAQQQAPNNNDSKRGGWVTFPFIIGLSLSLLLYWFVLQFKLKIFKWV